MQAAIYTHLPQSSGEGALVEQHGISAAIPSPAADMDISSAVACIEASDVAPAMMGRDNGLRTNPAITRIASSRRMANWRFT